MCIRDRLESVEIYSSPIHPSKSNQNQCQQLTYSFNISQMSVLNIKSTCFQRLKSRLYLPSFFVKCLGFVWFIERHYYLKLRNILFVYYPGSREITEFAINPNNLAIKGTFIDPEGIKQPRRLYHLTVGWLFNPEVLTYTNMI